MGYKEKYDKLVEAVKHLQEANPSDEGIQAWVNDNVPELTESEDKSIKKELLALVEWSKSYAASGITANEAKKMTAWLEKQGEKSQYWEPSEEQLDALDYAYNSCPDTERGNYYEGVLETIIDDLHKLSEKKGEQKPTDKAEPMFKIGDWISNGHITCQITFIDSRYWYSETCVLGNVIDIDKTFHLFTIEDAKDGDVLVYEGEIFLLKYYVQWHKIVYHCCYDGKNLHKHSIYGSLGKDDFDKVHPATREQWDTLKKAMADDGYTFDANIKELIKIEQKPTDKIEPKFHEGQWIVLWDEFYKVNYNGCGYELVDQNGLSTSLDYGTVEESAHVFTIQDAKDGDVLAYPDGSITVFKCMVENLYMAHVLWVDGHIELNNSCAIHNVRPATKEQCNALMRAMSNAGYAFNFVEKELIKIEQEPVNKVAPKFKVGDTIYYNSFGRLESFTVANIVEDGTDNPMYEDKDGNSVFQNYVVEQKPDDKDGAKFKLGDWIVQNGIGTYKIVEVCRSWYEVISYNDGRQYSIGFDKENDCHLFTIQDAKDGDVLCTANGNIFIFKNITKHSVYSYCGLYFGKFYETKGCVNGELATELPSDYVPATKEQRDQLKKAMADAGYTFDFEKKELREIDPCETCDLQILNCQSFPCSRKKKTRQPSY